VAGLVCRAGYCVSGCNGISCDRGLSCDPISRTCYDPCDGISCNDGEVCVGGICGGCEEVGCPKGMLCIDTGECIEDPCGEIECEPGQFCRIEEGPSGAAPRCLDSCGLVACALGETCIDGECRADPCGGIRCSEGEVCIDGYCAPDPCEEVECEPGFLCNDGQCIGDPCVSIRCPKGEECRVRCVAEHCVGVCAFPRQEQPQLQTPEQTSDPSVSSEYADDSEEYGATAGTGTADTGTVGTGNANGSEETPGSNTEGKTTGKADGLPGEGSELGASGHDRLTSASDSCAGCAVAMNDDTTTPHPTNFILLLLLFGWLGLRYDGPQSSAEKGRTGTAR